MTPEEVLKKIQDDGIKMLDLKFIDMPGTWQHLTVFQDQIDADSFVDGVPFEYSGLESY
jgi:glutamine synthetase